jgi:hypothetical protein
MENILYVMVTNWDLHWDKLGQKKNNSTLFTLPIIKDNLGTGPWPGEATTLFIKRTTDNSFERSWIGKSKNFRIDSTGSKTGVRFEISDLKEIVCPDEFKSYNNGWHLNRHSVAIIPIIQQKSLINEGLKPGFFKDMENCSWEKFELHCFHLLRLLGINDIHKFPQANNKGKADGFFKIYSLTVIYDATLEDNYLPQKEQQIENYINQLKKDKIPFLQYNYTIKDTQKQVWLITRGSTVKNLRVEDLIKVKEIPYTKLIEIYLKRLQEEIVTDDLCDMLKNI